MHELDDLDEEIRGHLALEIQDLIDRGHSPEAARTAALRGFGNVTLTRESIESVWRPRWVEHLQLFARDMRFALRSLNRARALAVTVVVTLALGIGANAAAFSVVREVLLRPLVNRDEDRLVYIRQSAPGAGSVNTTFSIPEINDLKARATTIAEFGDFSTVGFKLIGAGEPRGVQGGVVSGSYFGVAGLRPVLGRLIDTRDDGPGAARVVVLTYRFWETAFARDPGVVGRQVTLDSDEATVVGVLEPSVPYPADTEIIANVAASGHHLDAMMTTQRRHRMTELFGRLKPGVSIDDARAELVALHAEMLQRHPDAYPRAADMRLAISPLRDQIASPARTLLLLLLAAAAAVFLVACSNVANLILARGIRRESELAVCASLGASRGALRRMLLAESTLLCGAGAVVGVVLAFPLVAILSRFTARFSVRALDVTVDTSLLWVGAGLAMVASVLLAFVPRLPSTQAATGFGVSNAGTRITPGTNRRLRAFATSQMALSFVLLAAAGTVIATLISLQRTQTGYDITRVLAVDLPFGLGGQGAPAMALIDEAARRIEKLPGVHRVASGSMVPWRDADTMPRVQFGVEGNERASAGELPYGRLRLVTPGYFDVLGVRRMSGRDFSGADTRGAERVAVLSDTAARRLFPGGTPIGRRIWWAEPMFNTRLYFTVIGTVADADDEGVRPQPAVTVYLAAKQMHVAGRLFVQADDPNRVAPDIAGAIHQFAPDQPVERIATLEAIREDALAPQRLNAIVLAGFAGVALLIAAVGIAGTLAFSVSARTREFGVRLAVGSSPRHLLVGVLSEGARIAAAGIATGALAGYGAAALASAYFPNVQIPGLLPFIGAAAVLASAAVAAALMPAAKAARVDVLQALRSE